MGTYRLEFGAYVSRKEWLRFTNQQKIRVNIVVTDNQLPTLDHAFGRLHLFCNHAIRSLYNMGKSELGQALATQLLACSEEELVGSNDRDRFFNFEFDSGVILAPDLEKTLTSILQGRSDSQSGTVDFSYNYSGFGWFGRGLASFAAISTLGLLWDNVRHLADLPGAISALASAASHVALLYLSGELRYGANEKQFALQIALSTAGQIMPPEWNLILKKG